MINFNLIKSMKRYYKIDILIYLINTNMPVIYEIFNYKII